DDELSGFSFADEGVDEKADAESVESLEEADSFFGAEEDEKAGAKSTESLEEADSFFGAEEDEDSDFATADEFVLSLDEESELEKADIGDESDTDNEFAASIDDEGDSDEFPDFSCAEEGEDAAFSIESTESFDSEEFVLTPDAEEIPGDEQSIETATDENVDANVLKNDEQEAETTVESHFKIPSDTEALAEILSDNDDEILLDQEVEQHDRRESEEAELFRAEDVVAKDTEESVSAVISDQQDDKDQKADTDEKASLLDTQVFATAVAAVSSDPSLDKVKHIKELALTAKQTTGNTPQQIVVLHLLESTTALIEQKSALNTDDQVVIQELAAGLELAANDPFELAALVHHYTAWQQELFRSVVAQVHKESSPVEQPTSSSVPSDVGESHEAIQQVQEGFSQLRQAMMEEFNQLRKELHKG
ncbi:hypothetical protein VU04_02775, partial [Desulfobulbus sp. TB]|nr:hypothetical protein [Desulfobulbus sp. TB]